MSYLFYIFNKCLDSTYAINAKLYLTYCWTLKYLLHALLLLKCLISGNMYIHIIVAFLKESLTKKTTNVPTVLLWYVFHLDVRQNKFLTRIWSNIIQAVLEKLDYISLLLFTEINAFFSCSWGQFDLSCSVSFCQKRSPLHSVWAAYLLPQLKAPL